MNLRSPPIQLTKAVLYTLMNTTIEEAFKTLSAQPNIHIEVLVVKSKQMFLHGLSKLNLNYGGTKIVENPMSHGGVVYFMNQGRLLGSLIYSREEYEN